MRGYKITGTDKVLAIGVVISLLIISMVGISIGKPVLVDSWTVAKVNYFLTKLAELSTGFIISSLFYYLLVVIPDIRKYKVVRNRIEKLIDTAAIHQNRVINNLISTTNYNKTLDNIGQVDFEIILAILDEIIEEDKNHFRDNILSHWYRYTILVEKHLLKITLALH